MTLDSEPSRELVEPCLDRELVVTALQEAGCDVAFEDWVGKDDNEVLGDIAGLSATYGIDMDQLFNLAGIPVELRWDTE